MKDGPVVNRWQVEIEWGDCDPAGIVFYPNYFRFFDAATAHLFEAALGMKKAVWTERHGIVGIPMVDTGAKFLRPARFGDVVTIESEVQAFRRSSFDVRHTLLKNNETAIEAYETRVWSQAVPGEPHAIRSKQIPDEVIAAFGATRQDRQK